MSLEAEFTANVEDFKYALEQIKRLQKKLFEKGNCKIKTLDAGLEIITIGMVHYVHAETKGSCEVIVPIKLLYSFIRDCQTQTMYFKFNKNKMQCGSVIVETSQVDVSDWIDEPIFDFSFNVKDIELLRYYIKNGDEKLKNEDILRKLRLARIKLDKAIKEATGCLDIYGVKETDLIELVHRKLCPSDDRD